ncbi:MAG: DUF2294 domain-containing protein [bacterium]
MKTQDLNDENREICCPLFKNKRHCSYIEEDESAKPPERRRKDFCRTKCAVYRIHYKLKRERRISAVEKTKDQIELAIGKEVGRFLKKQIGEVTENVTTRINDNTILVRFVGALSHAERNLIQDLEGAKLIKELKEKLIEDIKPQLRNIIKELTNAKVNNIHSDINTETGERIILFSLDENLEEKFKGKS